MILGSSQSSSEKTRPKSSMGKTKRKVKRAAQKARSMSFFANRLGKSSGKRTFSIFGNRLERHNNVEISNIMSRKFVLRDPTSMDRGKSSLSAGEDV